MSCLLGIDFGTKRLGFALAEPLLGSARPLETYTRVGSPQDWDAVVTRVRHHIQTWGITEVVIGVPYLLDGGETESTARARAFGQRLAETLQGHVPVEAWDETLTSFEADARMAEDGVPRAQRKAQRDAYAAAVMLDEVLRRRGTTH